MYWEMFENFLATQFFKKTFFEKLPIEILFKIFVLKTQIEMKKKRHNFEIQYARKLLSTSTNVNSYGELAYFQVFVLERKRKFIRLEMCGNMKTIHFKKMGNRTSYFFQPNRSSKRYPNFKLL